MIRLLKGDRLGNQRLRPDAHLAAVITRRRRDLGLRLLASIADSPKYRDEVLACGAEPQEFLNREIYAFVDYLALLFRTADSTYQHLYIGEKLKQLYEPGEDRDARAQRAGHILDLDQRSLLDVLAADLRPEQLSRVKETLDEIACVVDAQSKHTARVLLIGDCLYLDIMSFLAAPCLEEQISLEPTFVTSKNPVDLARQLRALSDSKFDMVFFSPFSYEFSPAYASLMNWRRALTGRKELEKLADDELDSVERTLRLLFDQFECPIVVHNSANVRRHDGSQRELAKNALTRRPRQLAAAHVNRRMTELCASFRQNGDPIVLLDETPLLQRHGDWRLGKIIYQGGLQHPAELGKHLAEDYRDLIVACMKLRTKKLIVCDLDNTLWHGVIGEGGIRHDVQRQQMLARLKSKGVLLAINSKNDPKNVHWRGAVLSADDFVCSQINWQPKSHNMQQIQAALNLKAKDFVFLDDRQDECELMTLAMPEVLSLNATNEHTWRLLSAWSNLLEEQDSGDRTVMYKQRDQRDGFIRQESAVDQTSMFEQLGIQVTIRSAQKADHKRVAELINRTNQFNLCGSRIGLKDLKSRCDTGEYQVVLVDASDRFGSMGTVSVLVLQPTPEAIEIPIFVLSCRVFGYGIEDALMNQVKLLAREAAADGTARIIGLYKETSLNQPCRDVYPRNGFTWDGERWTYEGAGGCPDPSWLSIERQLQPLPQPMHSHPR